MSATRAALKKSMATNMTCLAPVVNVLDFKELERRIRLSERHSQWVHIDVADGTFTPHAVWHNAQELHGFQTTAAIEIHLMVARPEEKIVEWFMPEVARIIFHIEAARDAAGIIQKTHEAHIESGVAICPDTSWEALLPFVGEADLFQTLAVMPGPSGQAFDRRILEKLKHLRKIAKGTLLEVDGGVHAGIARECRDAGANIIVAGSALFGEGIDFDAAFLKLSDDVAR
jgi:ribulose-phosphate 3-epimerase